MLMFLFLPCLIASSYCRPSELEDFNKLQYHFFSTLTPYDAVRGEFTHMPGCEAESVWIMHRHGTRFSYENRTTVFQGMTSFRDLILENHKNHRGQLKEQQLEQLQLWRFPVMLNESALLTPSGVTELKTYGRRLQRTFPHLFEEYSSDKIKINTTILERTKQSAGAVTEGLWDKPTVISESMVDDKFLRNYQYCPAWKKSLKSPPAKRELALFDEGPLIQRVISSVSKALGFEQDLSFETVHNIYELCAYENAWYHPKRSPWCAVFSTEELKVMEYRKDLKHYYATAHGNPLAKKIGCHFVSDLVSFLSKSDKLATLYYGHSTNIRILLATLGIARDHKPLTAENYKYMSKRQWRLSLLNPFAANVAVVKYRCRAKNNLKVRVFVNEKPVRSDACSKETICSLKRFTSALSKLTDPEFCTYEFCNGGLQKRSLREEDEDFEEEDESYED